MAERMEFYPVKLGSMGLIEATGAGPLDGQQRICFSLVAESRPGRELTGRMLAMELQEALLFARELTRHAEELVKMRETEGSAES